MAAPALPIAGQEACHDVGSETSPDATPVYGGATTYQVTSSGTLSTAVASASPGDVIEVQNGTYTWDLNVSCSGNATEYIIVKAESALGVTFTGGASANITGDYLWIEGFQFISTSDQAIKLTCDDTRLTRCYFSGCGTSGEETIRMNRQCNRIEIDNCEVTDSRKQSIIAFTPQTGESNYLGTQGHNIHHNYFHDIPRYSSNGGEVLTTINAVGPDDNEDYGNSFNYNKLTNCDGDIEHLSIKAGGWTIKGNQLNNPGGNLTLRSTHNCTVSYNIIENGGLRVTGSGHTIEYNHVHGSDHAFNLHHGYTGGSASRVYPAFQDNTIRYNYFSSPNHPINLLTKSYTDAGTVSGNTFLGNQFWREGSGDWWTGGQEGGDFEADQTWTDNRFWSEGQSYNAGELPSGTNNTNSKLNERNYECEGGDPADTTPPVPPTGFSVSNA